MAPDAAARSFRQWVWLQMYDVFISYARDQRGVVEPLRQLLEELGLHVFFDIKSIEVGEEFPDKIDWALKGSTLVVGVWTPHALARRWVRRECRVARDRGVLFPIAIEPVHPVDDVPAEFAGIHYVDMSGAPIDPHSARWQELADKIRRHAQDLSPSAADDRPPKNDAASKKLGDAPGRLAQQPTVVSLARDGRWLGGVNGRTALAGKLLSGDCGEVTVTHEGLLRQQNRLAELDALEAMSTERADEMLALKSSVPALRQRCHQLRDVIRAAFGGDPTAFGVFNRVRAEHFLENALADFRIVRHPSEREVRARLCSFALRATTEIRLTRQERRLLLDMWTAKLEEGSSRAGREPPPGWSELVPLYALDYDFIFGRAAPLILSELASLSDEPALTWPDLVERIIKRQSVKESQLQAYSWVISFRDGRLSGWAPPPEDWVDFELYFDRDTDRFGNVLPRADTGRATAP